MSPGNYPAVRKKPLVSPFAWFICALIGFLSALSHAREDHYSVASNPAYFLGSITGGLLGAALVWAIVQAIYRLITRKKKVA